MMKGIHKDHQLFWCVRQRVMCVFVYAGDNILTDK